VKDITNVTTPERVVKETKKDSELIGKPWLEIHTKTKSFLCYADSEEDAREWVETITYLLNTGAQGSSFAVRNKTKKTEKEKRKKTILFLFYFLTLFLIFLIIIF